MGLLEASMHIAYYFFELALPSWMDLMYWRLDVMVLTMYFCIILLLDVCYGFGYDIIILFEEVEAHLRKRAPQLYFMFGWWEKSPRA